MNADVCIVGAGAAGMTVAHALRASGRSVLVLESGPVADADLDTGETVGNTYNGLVAGRRRGPGGTTTVWPGQCMRLRPEDLAQWPFELDRWYDEAERLLGLIPGETGRDPWQLFGEPPPGFDPARIAYATSVFAPLRDLSTLDVGDASVLTGTTATRVAPGEVEARDEHGATVRVHARDVVLSLGTLETTRLLLVSGFDHPSLGRGFNDHVVGRPARVVGRARTFQDRYGLRRRGGRMYSPKLLLAGPRPTGCMANIVFDYRERSAVEAAMRVRRSLRARGRPALRDLGLVALGLPQVAGAGVRVARGREPAPPPESVHVLAIAEQPSRAESRLTLAESRDRLGMPRLRVDWRLGDEEHEAFQALVEALDSGLRDTGAGALEPAPWLGTPSWHEHVFDAFHPAGTARIGTVVDDDCALVGAPGVSVCGAAVFPATGCVNPTLTIVALALRLGDRLRAQ